MVFIWSKKLSDARLPNEYTGGIVTIFITGIAGYIGSHIALAFLDAGMDVVGIDNLVSGHDDIVPAGATFYKGDVGDTQLLHQIFGAHRIDTVIHCAAHTVVPESVRNPARFYENNTLNSCRLIMAAQDAGIENFIFSSTAAVYGIPDKREVHENDICQPINPYGWSKLMTERMLMDIYPAQNMTYAILRYFNVAGADPQMRSGQISDNATHLVKIAGEVATGKRDSMAIYGTDYDTPDGTCIRDYVHVSDLAEAHRQVYVELMNESCANIVLNCGYGRGVSVREVIETTQKLAGNRFDVLQGDRRAGDPPSLIANANHIRNVIDWRPQYNRLETIIYHALEWEKQLSQLPAP